MSNIQTPGGLGDGKRRGRASMITDFAGVMLVVLSVFQILEGITAVAEDDIYVRGINYVYSLDVTAWGWIHIALGVIGGAVGLGLLARQTWARIAGIAVASISAINNVMFLPHYPLWSIVLIAFDVFVIWALCFQLDDEVDY
jgi:hypothetical protein